MKTKFIILIACMQVVCIFSTSKTLAQQPQHPKPSNSAGEIAGQNASANYSYHVFEAPNKKLGYDIFLNGKIIFHQVASIDQPGIPTAVLAKKEHAEKAASMAIDKIKKGEPAALTQEEIKTIIIQ
ncbi:MAG: hypothetical protein ABI863_08385 [Ginsengibacter sp.]